MLLTHTLVTFAIIAGCCDRHLLVHANHGGQQVANPGAGKPQERPVDVASQLIHASQPRYVLCSHANIEKYMLPRRLVVHGV